MDASTLIYLAKARGFKEVSSWVMPMDAPPAVWDEAVVAGARIGAPDVVEIQRAQRAGLVRQVQLSAKARTRAARIREEHRLGAGESEVVAIGHEYPFVILDEGRATSAALAMGLSVVSALFLPVLAYRRGSLTPSRARQLLRRLSMVTGASAEVLQRFEEELR